MTEPNPSREYIGIPEESFDCLPEEWKAQVQTAREEAEGFLEIVDENLKALNRLAHALPTTASLRYIQHRLASLKFEPTMEWVLEHDMLTLAFVTTYVRLMDGGLGSGVSRKALPTELRPVHDQIVELRNKRHAHNAGHDTVVGNLKIEFENGRFDLRIDFEMRSQIGGAPEWKPLVEHLDGLMYSRLYKLLDRLKEKTGCEWTFPSGPPPAWVSTGTRDGEENKDRGG